MGTTKRWDPNSLKEAWQKMFDYSYYVDHFDQLEIQCVVMLLEGSLNHVKKMGSALSKTKTSEKELSEKLEEKTNECRSLKKQLAGRLECAECCSLRAALEEAKSEAKEAQARIDSIASILRIGDMAPLQARNQNAFDLVSQMLLGKSPQSPRNNAVESLPPVSAGKPPSETGGVGDRHDVVPESPVVSPSRFTNASSHTVAHLVPKSPIIEVNVVPSCRPLLDVSTFAGSPNKSRSSSAKKDLSSHFEKSNPKPNVLTSLDVGQISVNLLDCIKDVADPHNDSSDGKVSHRQCDEIPESPELVIDQTPGLKRKKADCWLLKNGRGAPEISKSSGRKMRQSKLQLGLKKTEKRVDLSKLDDDNSNKNHQTSHIELDIDSPVQPATSEVIPSETQLNSMTFQPIATSTQKLNAVKEPTVVPMSRIDSFDKIPLMESKDEPQYVYSRDAVRKKSERMKLEGWECKDCYEYYATMGKDMSAAEKKRRINECSRHRNKYNPNMNRSSTNFWNPVFPDTQVLKGYTSVCEDD